MFVTLLMSMNFATSSFNISVNKLVSDTALQHLASIYERNDESNVQVESTDGHLLSDEQRTELLQLSVPIVVPDFVPEGFRLTHASGEIVEYLNGDEYPIYRIRHESNNGECFTLYTPDNFPSGTVLENTQTEFGLIPVYMYEDGESYGLLSLVEIEMGADVMLSSSNWERAYVSQENSEMLRCKALDPEVFIQVLESLTLLQ
ncbi:hypothetical protein PN498_25480 [Oscillatoria sp. CS-180]|uniref:hypothetical protein n=1 Tax=Oscillatoria sp. CS-180 TaxID=3021720 RepID=UPI00232BABD0|nr:hypothetical protein [Oscillatoria sp. CS-180]MDB9529368.1 hypothetical protein [Oscillatoria sp. CS-180]